MYLAAIQARLGSKRLPQKVLMPLFQNKSILQCIVNQVQRSEKVSHICITTSNTSEDEKICELSQSLKIGFATAPVDNIISRLWNCFNDNNCKYLVRIWGDCPFVCPDVIDEMLEVMESNDLDFLTNADSVERNFLAGLDLEIYSRAVLEKMNNDVLDPKFREFPVEYVKRNLPKNKWMIFKSANRMMQELYGKFHLTVDYLEDYKAACFLYSALLNNKAHFFLDDLLCELNNNSERYLFSSNERNIEYKEFIGRVDK